MKKKDYGSFAAMFKREHECLLFDFNEGTLSHLQFQERQEQLERMKTSTIQVFMEGSKNFSPFGFREQCKPEIK